MCLVECCRDSDRCMMTTRCEAVLASSGVVASLPSSWRLPRSAARVKRRQLWKENEIHECDVRDYLMMHNIGDRGEMMKKVRTKERRNIERSKNERGKKQE